MIASQDYYLPISEKETVALTRPGVILDLVFGTGGVALVWRKGQEMPETVRLLELMRGVLNENTEGAGI